MATPARNPSATRQRAIQITAVILRSLKPGARTGTAEIQQRLTDAGIPITLRSVQRHLNALSSVLPIEPDTASPRGWRWMTDVSVARVSGGAA